MKFSEAKPGRFFILRLEDGDILHECIEAFARERNIRAAALIALGGADAGSKLVVGPQRGAVSPLFQWSRCWIMCTRLWVLAPSSLMRMKSPFCICTSPAAAKEKLLRVVFAAA